MHESSGKNFKRTILSTLGAGLLLFPSIQLMIPNFAYIILKKACMAVKKKIGPVQSGQYMKKAV